MDAKTESMTALQTLLGSFRAAAKSEREKGSYFEELIVQYLKVEPAYGDRYSDVWMYADWVKRGRRGVWKGCIQMKGLIW